MDVKSGNGEKFEIFSKFLAHPVETPWPILTVLYRMCAGLCPTYWTTFGIAEKNRNGSCLQHEWDHPQFFEYLTPLPPAPPGADGSHRGRGHVGRHCPYTNNIWCGSVHALLRYRSKTAKMQKFHIDSHSNENFICLFFRPPGAANPQKGRRHVPTQATPACKIWRESARGLLRNRWPNKQKDKKTYSKTNTSPFALLANGG